MDRNFQEIINKLNRKLSEANKFREKMAKRIRQIDHELKDLEARHSDQKNRSKPQT